MSYPFRFDFQKTLEAVAFLLRRERTRRMNYMRLIKVLYIAEREYLRETEASITGGHPIAMERGPVLEELLQLVRGQHSKTPEWSQFIRKDNYSIELIADPGVGHLSRYVTSKLEEVASRHEGHDEWDMVGITHQLPEWQKNDPGKSSKRIPLEHVLEAIGKLPDASRIVEGAMQEMRAHAFAQGRT